jgi:alcohol dehydrogenase class IV
VAGHHWISNDASKLEFTAALQLAGVDLVVETETSGEPDVQATLDLASQLQRAQVDVVIAVGGGSTLDLAKAAAALGRETDLTEALAGKRIDICTGPGVIALPTTAGSGAEVSRGAILLDTTTGRKRGVRGRAVAPQVALVDPELMLTNNALGTGISGFDAVSHAVETAVSRSASDLTIALSRYALRQLLWGVPASIAHPEDLQARMAAAHAATLMGINLVNSTTCLPHRLQYPLGALTGTPHGLGVSALMPTWLRRVSEVAPERLAVLCADESLRARAAADAVVEAVLEFRSQAGVAVTLTDLGVSQSHIRGLVERVEGNLQSDPGPIDPPALARLYQQSL